MDQTQKLLQSIVENARTGQEACEQLMNKTDNAQLRDELMTQSRQYQAFAHDAEKSLYDTGAHPHTKSPMSKMGMWMGLQMNTLTDSSPSHIADLIIQGSTMGVIGMTRDRNALPEADAHAKGIANNFIVTQQDCIERLKSYL